MLEIYSDDDIFAEFEGHKAHNNTFKPTVCGGSFFWVGNSGKHLAVSMVVAD